MSEHPVDFRVSYLDSSIDSLKLVFDSSNANFGTPANAYAYIDVSASVLGDIFQIQYHQNDDLPLWFFLDASGLQNIGLSQATMVTTSYADNGGGTILNTGTQDISAQDTNHFSQDFVRYVASQMFNSFTGAVLFTNTSTVENSIENTFKIDLSNSINPFDKRNGTSSLISFDAFGEGYLTSDQAGSFNLIDVAFQQLLAGNVQRGENFFRQANYTKQPFPFMAGDSVSIFTTINCAVGQSALTVTSPSNGYAPRTYRIIIKLT